MSRKMPIGRIFALSIFAGFITLEAVKSTLPPEIRQEIETTEGDVYGRLDEPTQEKVDIIAKFFDEFNKSTDDRVRRMAEAKLEELGQSEEVQEQGQNTKTIPSGSVKENQYFPSYNFSDDTLYLMVKLAAAEQGNTNIIGEAVEMCTMLNIAESWGINTEEGFRKFISSNPGNGGWFESASMIAESESGHPDNPIPRDSDRAKKMMEIAKRISKGERYIPKNIVEHVSYSSVDYIILDGVKYDKSEKDKYIKGRTIIVQNPGVGEPFTYGGCLAETTDPFGYYDELEEEIYFDFYTGKLIVNGRAIDEQVQDNSTFEQSNTSQTTSMTQEYQNNIKKEKISLNDDMKYAQYSKIHSDYAILYTNNNTNRKNITVCVNAGHGTNGGEDVRTQCHPDGTPKVTGGSTAEGAIEATAVASGMTFLNGTPERDVTLRESIILRDKLLEKGYDVLMIRETEDVQLDNIARTVIANYYADCHIAVHWNDTANDNGAFFMSVPQNDSYLKMEPVASTWKESNAFGKRLIEGLKTNGVKIFEDGSMEMDLTQTSYSSIPSIDIELGDRASDTSDQTLEQLAEGLVDGVELYFYRYQDIGIDR